MSFLRFIMMVSEKSVLENNKKTHNLKVLTLLAPKCF
jgi:hypothetical protein